MARPPRITLLHGDRLVNVAGESHYQDALRSICRTGAGEAVRFECTAVLVREPGNPHDANAVAVRVNEQLVGYLSRADAIAYGPLVEEIEARGRAAGAEAMVAGRGAESGTSNLGVFLLLPDLPADGD